MPEGMETQNQNTNPETSGADDIANLMGSMSKETKPANEPADNGGDKGQGNGGNDNGNKGESQKPAWLSQIGDITKDEAAAEKLSKFAKLSDFAKSYLELEAKAGNSIVKPADDASDDEKDAFYKALGKPESADKYSVKGEGSEAFRELAYKNNLTDEQAVAIYKSLEDMGHQLQAQQEANFQQQAKQTQADLVAEYGKDYQVKIEMLKRGLKTYGGESLGAKLTKAGLLADKEVVKLFILLGEQSAEAGSPTNTKGKADNYKSIEDGGHFSFIDDYIKDK